MDFPDIRQLRAFLTLAETGSFTAAGERLFLTQSAVSHSIKSLEEQLGCALVDRLGKKVTPTRAGEQLLVHARSIMRQMERAVDDVAAISKPGFGRLRIGAAPTICQYLLPGVIRRFRDRYPDFRISIAAHDTSESTELLEIGQLDIAIGPRAPKVEQHAFHPLFTDELVFVFSPRHRWAMLSRIEAPELASEQFIVYSKRSQTTRLILDHFRRLGLPFPSLIELGNMAAIKEFAKLDLGISILAPWIARQELEDGSLAARPLEPEPVHREWGVIALKNRPPSEGEAAFIELCELGCQGFGAS